jgi:nucleoside phosphorylase/glycosyltransferase involved in cell wall biosynthesis
MRPAALEEFLETINVCSDALNVLDLSLLAIKEGNALTLVSGRLTLGYAETRRPTIAIIRPTWVALRQQRSINDFYRLVDQLQNGQPIEPLIKGLKQKIYFSQTPTTWASNGINRTNETVLGPQQGAALRIGASWSRLFAKPEEFRAWHNDVRLHEGVSSFEDFRGAYAFRQELSQHDHVRYLGLELEFPFYVTGGVTRAGKTYVQVLAPVDDPKNWRIKWRTTSQHGITPLQRLAGTNAVAVIDGPHDEITVTPLCHEVALPDFRVRTMPAEQTAQVASAEARSDGLSANSDLADDLDAKGHIAANALDRERVLFMMNRWSSAAGGIQTVNRNLACALAVLESRLECVAVVTDATAEERNDAAAHGVRLISGHREDDWSFALTAPELTALPSQSVIAIIGHSYFSGEHALQVKHSQFKQAAVIQFVHMLPMETEGYKEYRQTDYVKERESKHAREQTIAKQAQIVACIGPRLFRHVKDQAAVWTNPPKVVQLNCGLSRSNADVGAPVVPKLLCLGRTDSIGVKGLDVFAYAAGRVTQLWQQHPTTREAQAPQFIVRGAKEGPEALEAELKRISKEAGTQADIIVRPYTTSSDDLRTDYLTSSAFVMPSRAEGYGLVACEALSLGVPVVVSAVSGFAEMMREAVREDFLDVSPFIVEIDHELAASGERLAKAEMELLLKQETYRSLAHVVLEKLMPTCSWESAARQLLDLVPVRPVMSEAATNPSRGAEQTPTALDVIAKHQQDLMGRPGVVAVQVRQAIMVVVEKGKAGGLPTTLDGIDVVVREIDGINFSSAPTVKKGDRVFDSGQPVGCVGPLVVDSQGQLYAATAAHVLSASTTRNYSLGATDGPAVLMKIVEEATDVAFVEIPGRLASPPCVDSASPSLGLSVKVVGPAGHVYGIIRGVFLSLQMGGQGLEGLFEIEVDDGSPGAGASGALVEDLDGRPIGILVAATVSDTKKTLIASELGPSLQRQGLRVLAEQPARPTRKMTLGVLIEDGELLTYFLATLQGAEQVSRGIGNYVMGELGVNGPLTYVQRLTSTGNLAAAVTTTNMLRDIDVDFILHIGLAGGIAPAKRGDVIIASEVVHYEPARVLEDITTPRFQIIAATPKWIEQIARDISAKAAAHVIIGGVASGEKVMHDSKYLEDLLGGWRKVVAVEMESAGVAQAASSLSGRNPPLLIVKSVADVLGAKSPPQRDEASRAAVDVAANLARAVASALALTRTR